MTPANPILISGRKPLPSRLRLGQKAIVVEGNNKDGELATFNIYPNSQVTQESRPSIRLATEFVPLEGPYEAEGKIWYYIRFDNDLNDGWITECDHQTYFVSSTEP